MNPAYSLSVVRQTALVLAARADLARDCDRDDDGFGVHRTSQAILVLDQRACSCRRRSWRFLSLGRTHTDLYAAVALNDDLSFYARLVLLFSAGILLGMAHREPSDARAGEFFGALLIMSAGVDDRGGRERDGFPVRRP